MFIVRAGISRNANNNDLVFIGKCVNLATAIANQAKAPDHIEISEKVFVNLNDSLLYSNNKNMWSDGTVVWNDREYDTKCTSYYWSLE